jgi:hypothetical protein
MGLTISTILKRQAEIVAKVENGGYLRELVNDNFPVLQKFRQDNPQAKIDDPESESDLEDLMSGDVKLAWKQLSRLGKTPIFFSASKYIDYRPFPEGLTDEQACSLREKEFDRWVGLNRVHHNLRSHSKGTSGRLNDKLSDTVASKLATDTNKDKALAKSCLERSCPIYLSELECRDNEQYQSMIESRYRWMSAQDKRPGQDTLSSAEDDSDTDPFAEWKGAYKSMTWLLATFKSVVPLERRQEWLDDWQNSIQATRAEFDCADSIPSIGSVVETAPAEYSMHV